MRDKSTTNYTVKNQDVGNWKLPVVCCVSTETQQIIFIFSVIMQRKRAVILCIDTCIAM